MEDARTCASATARRLQWWRKWCVKPVAAASLVPTRLSPSLPRQVARNVAVALRMRRPRARRRRRRRQHPAAKKRGRGPKPRCGDCRSRRCGSGRSAATRRSPPAYPPASPAAAFRGCAWTSELASGSSVIGIAGTPISTVAAERHELRCSLGRLHAALVSEK